MAKKVPSILEINLKNNGGKISFASTTEINDWINNQFNFYAWMDQARSKHSNVQYIWEHFSNRINQLRAPISQIQSSPSLESTYLVQFKDLVESTYQNNLLINSSTAKAKFIDKLSKIDEVVAAHALGYFIGQIGNISNLTKASYEGFFKATSFEEGIGTTSSENTALIELKTNFDDYLHNYKSEADNLENQLEETLEKLETEKQEFISKHTALLESHQIEFLAQLQTSSEELKNIEEAYDKKMALQASITYWEGREDHHHQLAKKFSWAAIIVLVLSLGIIAYSSSILMNFELQSITDKPDFSIVTHIPIWRISLIVLLISLFIWIERILVRLLLSNLHLETDAGERVVMAKTYIALLREGNAPKDEDRKLILASLFRPNVTGLVNDDAMPFNLEKMQNIISGK